MVCAGIDIGSRTIEVVLTKDTEIIDIRQDFTGYDPLSQVKKMLADVAYDQMVATGYGRMLLQSEFDCPAVTEIKAYALGVHHLYPDVHTILDIGGQDCKVISLFENGRIKKFEMNDRCAAGTGKFLEIMATSLGCSIQDFGAFAMKREKDILINSMCTVFAESEVVSLIAKGENRHDIAFGLHQSVAKRAASMLKRVGILEKIAFAGGVANNSCIHFLLQNMLDQEILVPENPQFLGAYGAALVSQASI